MLIDSVLLDLTERCCQRFQLLTGRTNVWLAVQLTNLSIIVYFIWAAAFLPILTPGFRAALGVFFAALFYGLTQTILKVPIETTERNAYGRVAKGLRNPRRVRDVLLRVSFLTLSVFMLTPSLFLYLYFRVQIAALTYSLIVLTTVVLYLLACDPLPPCPGRIREWIRGAAPARLDAETSSNRLGQLD